MNIFDLIINDKAPASLQDIFLDDANRLMLDQLLKEHKHVEELSRYGLPVNNKILLYGSSGCGKTTTAKALANALNKNILILNLSNVICSRMGETSQNIKQVFDKAGKEKAVLFLDEFDQIGKERSNDDKDVGEMRRLVNTLIQLIDYYPPHALLLCATNHPEMIDKALLRRFQLRLGFEMPQQEALDRYYDQLVSGFPAQLQHIKRQYNISFAEARDYAFTQVKWALIQELEEKQAGMGNIGEQDGF